MLARVNLRHLWHRIILVASLILVLAARKQPDRWAVVDSYRNNVVLVNLLKSRVHDPVYIVKFASSFLDDTCCSKHLYRHVALLLCDFGYDSRCGSLEPLAVTLLNEAVVQNDDSLAAFILGRHLLGQGLTDRAFEVWAMIDEVAFSRWLVASAENAVDQNQGQYALELASAAVRAEPGNPNGSRQPE
jgi:hypothetical protein